MASVRKGIELSVGPFTTVIAIEAAESKPAAPITVCLGQTDPHDPSPGRKPHTCDICGPITDYSRTAKALKSGDTYALVDGASLKEMTDDLSRPFLNPAFTPSPRDQVDHLVADSEKLYYLEPRSAGSAYANIRSMVKARPDLAFMGLFTPTTRSKATLFELTVRDDVLVLVERRLLANLKALPAVEVEADKWEAMAVAAVDALVTDFDASTYDIDYAEKVAARFEASDQRITIAAETGESKVVGVDDTELGRKLELLVAAAGRKPTAKKAAAKKAVAAKTTTKTPAKRAARKVAKTTTKTPAKRAARKVA